MQNPQCLCNSGNCRLLQSCLFFSDRPASLRSDIAFKNCDILFTNDSVKWRYMKKQVMIALRQHSEGMKYLETTTVKFCTEMLESMKAIGENAFDPYIKIRRTIGCVMMDMIYGKISEPDLERFNYLEEILAKMFEPEGTFLLLDMFPALRFVVPSIRKAYNELTDVSNEMQAISRKLMEKRQKEFDEKNIECVIDHFVNLCNNQSNGNGQIYIDDNDINMIGFDLMIAGISTSSTLLYILIGILVNHPRIQETAYQEIMKNIGDKTPTLQDKVHLPYIEALILETCRYSSMNALSIPICARVDTELNGYSVPKGTIIFPNIWNLHHDER